MAQFHFLGTRNDVIELIQRILFETDLRVLQMHSEPEEPLREYKSVEDFCHSHPAADDGYGFGAAINLTLWSPSILKRKPVRKYDLSPDVCNGKRYAYEALDASAFYLRIGRSSLGGIEESCVRYGHARPEQKGRNWKYFSTLVRKLRNIVLIELASSRIAEKYSGISPTAVMKEAAALHLLKSVPLMGNVDSKFQYSMVKTDA